MLVAVVLVRQKRKRENGTLWLPEGFGVPKKQKRREPIGQDGQDLNLKVSYFFCTAGSSVNTYYVLLFVFAT